jgi:hypothetical protein
MKFEELLVEILAVKYVELVRTLMAQAAEQAGYLEPTAERVVGISDDASIPLCSDKSGVKS